MSILYHWDFSATTYITVKVQLGGHVRRSTSLMLAQVCYKELPKYNSKENWQEDLLLCMLWWEWWKSSWQRCRSCLVGLVLLSAMLLKHSCIRSARSRSKRRLQNPKAGQPCSIWTQVKRSCWCSSSLTLHKLLNAPAPLIQLQNEVMRAGLSRTH